MGKHRSVQGPPRRRGWRWMVSWALGLIAVGAAASWWLTGVPGAGPGTSRLVVDRTDVDLGYQRFDVPARVVFTLTNGGDGALSVTETPRVVVKAGC